MCYLDVIGPGPWQETDYLMDGSTFTLITGLIIFCFVAIAVSVIVLLVVMRRRHNKEKTEVQPAKEEKQEIHNHET